MIAPAKAIFAVGLLLIAILLGALVANTAKASTPADNETAFFRPEKPAHAGKLWEGSQPLPCNIPRYRLAYLPIYVMDESGRLVYAGAYVVRQRC